MGVRECEQRGSRLKRNRVRRLSLALRHEGIVPLRRLVVQMLDERCDLSNVLPCAAKIEMNESRKAW